MENDCWEHISAPLVRALEKALEAMRERDRCEADAAKRRKLAEEALGR